MTLNINNDFRSVADAEADKFDRGSRCVSVISENHRLIHEGMFFSAIYRDVALAADASIEILFSVPAFVYPHFQLLQVTSDAGPISYWLYEGTTTSDDGAALSGFNRNRNSANVPDMLMFTGPTITDDGTLIDQHNMPTIGNKVGIFDESDFGEWVLKPETKYLLRFTNNNGQARDVEIRMAGYEINWQNAGK